MLEYLADYTANILIFLGIWAWLELWDFFIPPRRGWYNVTIALAVVLFINLFS